MNFKIKATESELKRWIEWLIECDTGISSKTIAFVMIGVPVEELQGNSRPYPHDADDFSRCHELLERLPEWKNRIMEMAEMGKVWGWMADHWAALDKLYVDKLYDELYKQLDKAEEFLENDGAAVIKGKKSKIILSIDR